MSRRLPPRGGRNFGPLKTTPKPVNFDGAKGYICPRPFVVTPRGFNNQMKKYTFLTAALAAFSVILAGCAGNGTDSVNNGGGGGNVVTSDAPAASGDFLSLKPGAVVLRHAEGEHAIDHSNVAKLLQVRTDPDEARLGLLETIGDFTFNHGFSGTPVLTSNGVVGAIRQGSYNSSGMPDNTHAEMIDLKQMLEEFRSSRASSTSTRRATSRSKPTTSTCLPSATGSSSSRSTATCRLHWRSPTE